LKRIALLLTLLLATSFAGTTGVTATKPNPNHKVTICHATAAFVDGEREYTTNNVDIASSGYVKGGHHKPTETLGAKHKNGGDIIPPYTYGDFSYPGQNWTKKGQAIWNNGCKVPPPPPPPKDKNYDPQARVRVCGDPRLLVTLNNRRSDGEVVYRLAFTSAKTGEKRVQWYRIPAGGYDILWPKWIIGKSWVNLTAVDEDGTKYILYRSNAPKATPWGQGYCPAGLQQAKNIAKNH
jgi:hypothetical protein